MTPTDAHGGAMENELPGMLALQQGVEQQVWPHTVDARLWAEKYNESLVEQGLQPMDPAMLVGWFANAIMAGYDTASLRIAHALREAEECGEQAVLNAGVREASALAPQQSGNEQLAVRMILEAQRGYIRRRQQAAARREGGGDE